MVATIKREDAAHRLFMDVSAWTADGNGNLKRKSLPNGPSAYFWIEQHDEESYYVRAKCGRDTEPYQTWGVAAFQSQHAAKKHLWEYFKGCLLLAALTPEDGPQAMQTPDV